MKLRSVLMASAIMALPMAAAHAQAIDGLYVGGGIGANYMQRETFTGTGAGATSGTLRSGIGPALVMSLGWGFGNGLRAEIEGNYRENGGFNNPQGFGGPASAGGTEQKYGAMANVLYDLVGVVPVVQPYVGLGLGYEGAKLTNTHITAGGGTGTLTTATKGSFAYQAILGAAYPVPNAPGLSLTAEYRFMGLAQDRTYSAAGAGGGSVKASNDYNHSLLVGVRYAFGAAPVAAAYLPDTGRPHTYIVFFDWNKSDLTGRAQQIVHDAAVDSTSHTTTRIDVSGNADTSGTPSYNMGLSERRAQVVAADLVRNGVPASEIAITANGDTRLLVPTGPGVREPQNRRVEIVLH